MKIAGFLIALVVASSVLVGLFTLQSQSLQMAGENNPRMDRASDNMTSFVNKMNSSITNLEGKMRSLETQNDDNTDVFGFFQQLPALLGIGIDIIAMGVDLPSELIWNIDAMFPWLPPWFIPMLIAIVIIFVIVKIYFALRGTSEV